jgi:hypothetical protein
MALEFDKDDIDWNAIFCTRDTEDPGEVIPADSDSEDDGEYNLRDVELGREDSEEEAGGAIQLQRTQFLRENLRLQGKDVVGPIRQVLTAMDEAGIDLTILLDGVSWGTPDCEMQKYGMQDLMNSKELPSVGGARLYSARVVVTVTDVTDTGLPYMKCPRRSRATAANFLKHPTQLPAGCPKRMGTRLLCC